MKLEEGKSYTFKVVKTIRFERSDYFVFQGPDTKRYLVPSARYKNYNIEPGSDILCRIDKINCKGEVFLEPEHPYYKEGASFLFDVIGKDIRVDRTGKKHDVILVLDKFTREISVPISSFGDKVPEVGEKVDLIVRRIAKGNVLFTVMVEGYKSEKKEEETIYDFIIIEEVKGFDGREYFLVSDINERQYTVPSVYYRHYGLSLGMKFKGKFIRYKVGEEVRIEPLNPFFIPGKNYTFIVIEVLNLNTNKGLITVVADQYGFNHNVDGDLGIKPGGEVVLAVERIRKGWPLLRLV